MSPGGEWPPPERRFRAALGRGRKHLEREEWFAAYTAFLSAGETAEGEDRELARGLVHLAAAGYKRLNGDVRGAERQLAHARRRLERYRPGRHGVDLEALL